MARLRALEALMDNYQNFDIGELQTSFDQDKTIELVKLPVQRYSYALMRASLNVFVHHHFADPLNSLAFDRENFVGEVQIYVPKVWRYYLEDARASLPTATVSPVHDLEFKDWIPGGSNRFGAWHRIDFREFEIDVLLQVSNAKARLGAFEGLCFLHNDMNLNYPAPGGHAKCCSQLGSAHMQIITDEILESLGISPESAISAIKWQMK